jgi:ABC-2 type transport system ATP-binding protein
MAGLEAHQGMVTADHSPLKNHLGLLLTEPFFFSRITGEEYLRLMCQARGVALEDVATRNIFDLPLQQYASTYSTGMKKKLALMAILLQENKYFILDEPFNGVDIQSNLVLTGIIHKLRDMGKVVILSSHIFSTLRDSCDEILLLHKNEPIKRVLPHEYEALEETMKAVLIGDRIDRLGIG